MKNIEDYLNDNLSENESNEITKVLLKDAVATQLEQRWNNILTKKENPKIRPQQKNKRIKRYWLGIAASILLLLVAGLVSQYFTQPSYDDLLSSHLEKPHPNYYSRKGDTIAGLRTSATNAYASKNFASASKYYEEISLSGTSNIIDNFYLGLSYLYDDQPKKAIEAFKVARLKPLTTTFSSNEEIIWYLSLAYLKNNQQKLAKNELKYIIDNNLWRKKDAVKLLHLLND